LLLVGSGIEVKLVVVQGRRDPYIFFGAHSTASLSSDPGNRCFPGERCAGNHSIASTERGDEFAVCVGHYDDRCLLKL